MRMAGVLLVPTIRAFDAPGRAVPLPDEARLTIAASRTPSEARPRVGTVGGGDHQIPAVADRLEPAGDLPGPEGSGVPGDDALEVDPP